jgi:hypothetical protein
LIRTGSKREIAAAISANFAQIISRFAPPQWRGSSTGQDSQTASWDDHSGGIENPAAAAFMGGTCTSRGELFQLQNQRISGPFPAAVGKRPDNNMGYSPTLK